MTDKEALGPARPHPGGTREAILAAARAELAATGEFSVNAVARRAAVSRQTVQYHFGGAKGVRRALVEEGLAQPEPEQPTYDRLVDAAVQVFARPGASIASIDSIAAAAGLTKGAFYHHFADRRELLTAVARRISPVGEMLAVLETTDDLPAREALVVFTSTFYRLMRARSPMVANLAANSARDPELAQIVMGEILGRAVPNVLVWFHRRVERGDLRPIDPTLLIQALFGPVFIAIVMGPAVMERIKTIGIHPAVENVEAYVDLVLDGVAPYLNDDGTTRR